MKLLETFFTSVYILSGFGLPMGVEATAKVQESERRSKCIVHVEIDTGDPNLNRCSDLRSEVYIATVSPYGSWPGGTQLSNESRRAGK